MWSLFEYAIVQVITFFFRLTTATGIQAKPFASHKGFQWALVCFPIVEVFLEFVYKKAFIK